MGTGEIEREGDVISPGISWNSLQVSVKLQDHPHFDFKYVRYIRCYVFTEQCSDLEVIYNLGN